MSRGVPDGGATSGGAWSGRRDLPATRRIDRRTPMTRPPIARIAGPIALGTGALLLIQQLVMASFIDRSQIETTMANPLVRRQRRRLLRRLLRAARRPSSRSTAGRRRRPGRSASLGFLAALVGTMFLAGDLWFEAFAVPWLGDVAPASLHLAGGDPGGRRLHRLRPVRGRLGAVRASPACGPASSRCRSRSPSWSAGSIGFQAALPPFAIPLALAIGCARRLDDPHQLGRRPWRTPSGCLTARQGETRPRCGRVSIRLPRQNRSPETQRCGRCGERHARVDEQPVAISWRAM